MKKWIFVAISSLSLSAGAQTVLPLPDADPSSASPPVTASNDERPAMKPLDPQSLPSLPEEQNEQVATSPQSAPVPARRPEPSGSSAQDRPMTAEEQAHYDLWFGGGNSRPQNQRPRPAKRPAPVPPAEMPASRSAVAEAWFQALRLCIPPEGMSAYTMVHCPTYANAGVRYALENRALYSALAEFDSVQDPYGRQTRLFGSFKRGVQAETGIQAAACWVAQGALTECVAGSRNAVLRWIRGN